MSEEIHHLWPHWVDLLKSRDRTSFITYGTLINKESIRKTVSGSLSAKPVVALGVRRIFNFALMDENYVDQGGRYERSPHENHISTLNIQYTGQSSDKVNGILLSFSSAETDAIAEREYGYDIVPVDYEVNDMREPAFMFIARKSREIGYRVRDDILPNESALITCLTGAYTYGREFLDMWIRSCFLADGKALMEHPHYRDMVDRFLAQVE